jgi:hypothetical protein
VPIINTNINPGNDDYLQYYLEDRNIFSFGSQLGISATASIVEDVVETDVSLLPFTDIVS